MSWCQSSHGSWGYSWADSLHPCHPTPLLWLGEPKPPEGQHTGPGQQEMVPYPQSSSSSFHRSSISPHPIWKWIPKNESRLLKLHCHPWCKPFLQCSAPWALLFPKAHPQKLWWDSILHAGHTGNLCPQGACNPNCNSAIPLTHEPILQH